MSERTIHNNHPSPYGLLINNVTCRAINNVRFDLGNSFISISINNEELSVSFFLLTDRIKTSFYRNTSTKVRGLDI